ncbi:MAG TPA: NAD(P)/FAD-dependent oxidoreductase, partial [Gammaproteobacteria bacterium]|nr:NAD(P)/FAD-dependent oxidoreductase [Gammaproteobacteria bacterium]
VAAIGVPKHGADFADSGGGPYRTYRFRRALDCHFPHAFEVKREEFDQLLFKHAMANGVDAREGVEIKSVAWGDEDGRATAEAVGEDGEHWQVRARYVVDATGRDTLLGNQFKLKQRNPKHQSAAIYAHFTGVERWSGENAGNISIYWMPHGWIWVIPLRDGVTSIGCVCWPDYLRQRRGATEEFLLATLKNAPQVWKRMENATRVCEVRVSGNYSYTCDRIAGKGWIMVGDAFAFLDPVFSSGVYLAMSSARRAVAIVDAVLRDPSREAALQRDYERRTRRGLRNFSWFIYRFTAPAMQALFMAPRNILRVEQAVTSMLAGDVFGNRSVERRLRFFKTLYVLSGLARLPDGLRSLRLRRRAARSAAVPSA